MSEGWIRASEIGEYLYCQRAWWYRREGEISANAQELAQGTAMHLRHGLGLQFTTWLRFLAYALIVSAALLLLLQLFR